MRRLRNNDSRCCLLLFAKRQRETSRVKFCWGLTFVEFAKMAVASPITASTAECGQFVGAGG
jgi:hypothetical protein